LQQHLPDLHLAAVAASGPGTGSSSIPWGHQWTQPGRGPAAARPTLDKAPGLKRHHRHRVWWWGSSVLPAGSCVSPGLSVEAW